MSLNKISPVNPGGMALPLNAEAVRSDLESLKTLARENLSANDFWIHTDGTICLKEKITSFATLIYAIIDFFDSLSNEQKLAEPEKVRILLDKTKEIVQKIPELFPEKDPSEIVIDLELEELQTLQENLNQLKRMDTENQITETFVTANSYLNSLITTLKVAQSHFQKEALVGKFLELSPEEVLIDIEYAPNEAVSSAIVNATEEQIVETVRSLPSHTKTALQIRKIKAHLKTIKKALAASPTDPVKAHAAKHLVAIEKMVQGSGLSVRMALESSIFECESLIESKFFLEPAKAFEVVPYRFYFEVNHDTIQIEREALKQLLFSVTDNESFLPQVVDKLGNINFLFEEAPAIDREKIFKCLLALEGVDSRCKEEIDRHIVFGKNSPDFFNRINDLTILREFNRKFKFCKPSLELNVVDNARRIMNYKSLILSAISLHHRTEGRKSLQEASQDVVELLIKLLFKTGESNKEIRGMNFSEAIPLIKYAIAELSLKFDAREKVAGLVLLYDTIASQKTSDDDVIDSLLSQIFTELCQAEGGFEAIDKMASGSKTMDYLSNLLEKIVSRFGERSEDTGTLKAIAMNIQNRQQQYFLARR